MRLVRLIDHGVAEPVISQGSGDLGFAWTKQRICRTAPGCIRGRSLALSLVGLKQCTYPVIMAFRRNLLSRTTGGMDRSSPVKRSYASKSCRRQRRKANPMTRALLVIDVQREYFDGALPITYPAGHLENILAVMDQAAKSKLPTAVIRHHQAGSPVAHLSIELRDVAVARRGRGAATRYFDRQTVARFVYQHRAWSSGSKRSEPTPFPLSAT